MTVAEIARAADVSSTDGLQLLPDQGGPRLLAARVLRGGAARHDPRPRRRASRCSTPSARFVRAPRGMLGDVRRGDARAAGGAHAHDRLQPGAARARAADLRGLHARARGADPRRRHRARVAANALIGVHRALVDFARRARPRGRAPPELAAEVRARGRRARSRCSSAASSVPRVQRIALVRPPSSRMGDGIVTHLERTAVDPELAARAARRLRRGARRRGLGRSARRRPADELPDSAFIEDTMVVCDGARRAGAAGRGRARAPRSRAPSRRCASSGSRSRGSRRPGTLDGGDVLQVGDTVYVGRGGRTNGEGIRQLRAHLPHRTVVPVPLGGVLHLKSAVTALPDGTIVCADRVAARHLAAAARAHRPRGGRRPRRAARRGPRADGRLGAAHGGALRRLGLRRRRSSTSASSSAWRAASPACRCSSRTVGDMADEQVLELAGREVRHHEPRQGAVRRARRDEARPRALLRRGGASR